MRPINYVALISTVDYICLQFVNVEKLRPNLFIKGAGMKPERDIEKNYSTSGFVAKLRRLADALEHEEKFEIQIAGERIYVPVRAEYSIEHERGDSEEEIEFQIKWSNE